MPSDVKPPKWTQGPRGEMGLEGRTPIHVMSSKPSGSLVEEGDIWYNPSKEEWKGYTGKKWVQLLAQGEMGIIGLEGEAGKDGKDATDEQIMRLIKKMGMEESIGKPGKDGKDGQDGRDGEDGKDGKDGVDGKQGKPGKDGKDGQDGRDATLKEVRPIVNEKIAAHEKKYDHTLIDPFLVGTKEVSEANISDGMSLMYDSDSDKLVYGRPRPSHFQSGGRGTNLPSQIGNSGKYLTTDGLNASWSTVSGGSGITRSVNSVSTPTTAGSTADTDYVYFVSSATTLTLPTAVGNTNRYTVKNVDTGTVTVDTTSSQTIDGDTSISLLQNVSVDLISDGSNWNVV